MAPLSKTPLKVFPHITDYTLTEQLYEGRRTAVYKAVSVQQKPVVIKMMRQSHPDFSELVHFRNQYAITKNLSIPGVVHPLSLESWQNGYALVMEDFGGCSLQQYTTDQTLTLKEVLSIGLQMADVLHGLNQHCVVHKDIKPANILIHPESKRIQLIDFSIATLLHRERQELQSPNVLEGTLAYLAPEQTGRINRGIDYRTDFYGLGVTLYELLTGQVPFSATDPLELVHCHIAKVPLSPHAVNAEIPAVVSQIVLKLMAKNVEERYQSALGLKHDLARCLQALKERGEESVEIAEFELGQRDVSDCFLISEKLYGRDAEVQSLLAAFERVADGSSELILVTGFSGIGKTVVVNEVHRPIVRQRGYFIKGKFDQFNRNIPLSGFVQALRDLMRQILSESDAQLEQWRKKVLSAVGENGQVLIEVIPEIEQIIGKQPVAPELSGSAVQNRFNLLLQKFVRAFTTATHPLVLFLDDLQWADPASLQLLKLLMENDSYLLILGAYRDNEVSLAHPFMLTVEEIKKAQRVVHTVTLEPLALSDINQLVADTLSCDRTLARPLSELVNRKTKGNPFFTTQFLKALYEDGCISFNYDLQYWECDIIQVNALALTDDVVEFMTRQLQKLPSKTQQVLKLASCIGNQFDLATLAAISEQSSVEAAQALWKALEEGLILPNGQVYKFFQEAAPQNSTIQIRKTENPTYRFLHDRAQQAAYLLIPQDERALVHYKIGRRLLEKSSPTVKEGRIFELVNHLNYGIEKICDRTERDELAQLNLIASRKARAASAYQAAYEYANVGVQLLGSESWQRQYSLMLALCELAADAASLCGQYERMEQWVEAVVQFTQTPLEQVNIYQTKILALAAKRQPIAAVKVGENLLAQLGFRLPEKPTDKDIELVIREVVAQVGEHPVETLFYLPEMTNVQQLAIQRVAATILPICYVTNPQLYPILVALQVKRSIQFGNSPASATSYACYGCLLISILQSVELAQQFGQLAYRLALEPSAKSYRSSALVPIGLFLHHRTSHLRETLPMLQEGYQVGVETGALFDAGSSALFFCGNAFWCGQPLAEIEPQIKAYLKQISDLNLDMLIESCSVYWKGVLRLFDPESYQLLISQTQESDAQEPSRAAYRTYYLFQFTTNFLLGNLTLAAQQAGKVKEDLQPGASTISEAIFYFYDSLIALAMIPENPSKKERLQQQVEDNQVQLKMWARYAPMNYQHKWQLVEAEYCRVYGDKLEAIDLYDQAIKGAETNGYIQEEALANELAAKFYLAWGKEKIATAYMQTAYYRYAHWGAKAKVQDLEQRYPALLLPILQQQPSSSFSIIETIDSSNSPAISSSTIAQFPTSGVPSTSAKLDLATVLKASQTLSSAIQLDKLLSTLLHTVLENAGADKGALLLPNEGKWFIEAIATIDQPAQIRTLSLSESGDVPNQVIHTVKRTLEPVVIPDACTHPTLSTNTYVLKQQPKSILCTPIIHQNKLVAILYLENQITIGAFTSDRIKLLNLLCTQAAISLENARLYQQAQDYTLQLEQSQLQTVQAEKMASLGNLVAGVAHEINNPIGFLNGSVENAKTYLQDLSEYLMLYQQHHPQAAEPVQEKAEDIDLDFLLEDFPKLLNSMTEANQRIKSISTSLRTFSRADTEHKVSADLHEGLDSTLLILKYRLKANENRPEVKVIKDYGVLPIIDCFPGQLNQVFMNLLANAVDIFDEAAEQSSFAELIEKPQIITVKTILRPNQNGLEIRIGDNGKGMTEEVKARSFDHLFTTKGVGKGTGLGLAISQQIIVEKHGGSLTVQSELGQGTEFCIQLPLVTTQAEI